MWSGGRHIAHLHPTTLTLETDCARADFPRPQPDASGRFRVEGRLAPYSAGPQNVPPEDGGPPAATVPATLEGRFHEGRLEARLTVAGQPPQALTLTPGNSVRLIRCL
jgi:hypothetical protein